MFRWLVNIGLLALPIGVTIGVLLGIEQHRVATGQSPLFRDDGIKTERYCEKTIGIHPISTGLEYTLNPNQWNWNTGDPGSLCMNVTSFNNKTYATETTAPEFLVTWKYPQGPETAPVHAFPNIEVDSDVLSVALSDLANLNLDVEWTYGVGKKPTASIDEQTLTENLVNTNVAVDMFLDSDKTKARDPTKAGFEVMVWLAMFGPATQPLGYDKNNPVETMEIEGVKFDLFTDQNSLGQYVLTWVAEKTTDKFTADLAPLVAQLLKTKKKGYPTAADYLGYVGFGSEAYWSNATVTFHVPNLSIDIKKSAS
ncbi:Fc.00g104150.m01.CDS01 [Cosmosporella sp. VM-42]